LLELGYHLEICSHLLNYLYAIELDSEKC